MSQFGRVRLIRKDDPLFESFLDDLSAKLHDDAFAWLGKSPQGLANIVHAIAKMKLSVKGNSSAMSIMRLLEMTRLLNGCSKTEIVYCSMCVRNAWC